MIFRGGAVYAAGADAGAGWAAASAGPGRPADAVAVTGGKIAAIGMADDASPGAARPADRDRRVCAGGHCCPGSRTRMCIRRSPGSRWWAATSSARRPLDEALGRIRAYADAHPEREWISGSGWRMEWFERGTPSKAQLDQVTGSRPAFLLNRDVHGGWANSRALELAGFDARVMDPADGRFEREADGSLQGTVHEGAADLVGAFVPKPSFEERLAGLLLAQRHLHRARSHGVAGRDRRRVPGVAGPAAGVSGGGQVRAADGPGARARCGGSAARAPARLTACSSAGRAGRPAGSRPGP